MRKIVLSAFVLGAISLTSCKKDRTCECSIVTTTTGISVNTKGKTTIINDTKKNAEAKCDKEDLTFTNGTSSIVQDCKLN